MSRRGGGRFRRSGLGDSFELHSGEEGLKAARDERDRKVNDARKADEKNQHGKVLSAGELRIRRRKRNEEAGIRTPIVDRGTNQRNNPRTISRTTSRPKLKREEDRVPPKVEVFRAVGVSPEQFSYLERKFTEVLFTTPLSTIKQIDAAAKLLAREASIPTDKARIYINWRKDK
jgi:hypothetical protein